MSETQKTSKAKSEDKEVVTIEEDGSVVTDENKVGSTEVVEKEENEYEITFKKLYHFEGREYSQLDLSGIENLTTRELEKAEKQFTSTGNFSAISEMTVTFACIVAAMATKLPIEYFEGLPANEGIKVKNALIGYFYS